MRIGLLGEGEADVQRRRHGVAEALALEALQSHRRLEIGGYGWETRFAGLLAVLNASRGSRLILVRWIRADGGPWGGSGCGQERRQEEKAS
ncbi:MAG: hypothetical protein ACUVWR_17490 [Anaerolineae bacterium]